MDIRPLDATATSNLLLDTLAFYCKFFKLVLFTFSLYEYFELVPSSL